MCTLFSYVMYCVLSTWINATAKHATRNIKKTIEKWMTDALKFVKRGRGKESAATQIWQIFRMYRTRVILSIWNGVNACKYAAAAPSSTCLRLFHNLASNVNVSIYIHLVWCNVRVKNISFNHDPKRKMFITITHFVFTAYNSGALSLFSLFLTLRSVPSYFYFASVFFFFWFTLLHLHSFDLLASYTLYISFSGAGFFSLLLLLLSCTCRYALL